MEMISLDKGNILVTKTDTIYGILTRALEKESVEKIYEIKGRDENKPFIVLIPNKDILKDFGVELGLESEKIAKEDWPGPVTLIFDLPEEKLEQLEYLHRGSRALAFRVPDDQFLLDLLNKTGPLVAPSANPQGKIPAVNINQARKYFVNQVDVYHDRGEVLDNTPSKIIKISNNGKIKIIRG